MSRTYRVVARIFGTNAAVHHVRQAMTIAEANEPGYEFSIKQLNLSSHDFETYGIEIRGEARNHPSGFAAVDLQALTSIAPTIIVETVVDDSDGERILVCQGGKVVYRAYREEVTGDIYDIGQLGVEYYYGHEEGIRDMFLLALTAAGIKHKLRPL